NRFHQPGSSTCQARGTRLLLGPTLAELAAWSLMRPIEGPRWTKGRGRARFRVFGRKVRVFGGSQVRLPLRPRKKTSSWGPQTRAVTLGHCLALPYLSENALTVSR